MSNFVVIEPIINYQKVKYEKLKEIIPSETVINKTVNIYINMNSILEYFYTNKMVDAMNSLIKLDNIVFTAEFINLMAHYRHYFFSRHRSKTRFFIYYLNKPVSYDNKYMESMIKTRGSEKIRTGLMSEILDINLKLIDNICTYLPNIYFISSEGMDHSSIPYYLIKKLSKREDETNIVMTHDYYDYQLLNLPRTMILSASGDRSKMYTLKNIYDKKLSGLKYNKVNDISPELFSLIMSLTGHKDRDINKIDNYGFSKAIKKIDELLSNGLIKNGYNFNLTYLSKVMNVSENGLTHNFSLCDLRTKNNILKSTDEILITRKLINLRDNNAIMDINSRYFKFNNIHLIELEEGE